MHATPEGHPSSRLEQILAENKRRGERGQKLLPLGVPEVEAGEYLLKALFEAGPTKITPEGELPLDWATIWAYGQATEELSEPWEYRTVLSLSRDYLQMKIECKNGLARPPAERKRSLR